MRLVDYLKNHISCIKRSFKTRPKDFIAVFAMDILYLICLAMVISLTIVFTKMSIYSFSTDDKDLNMMYGYAEKIKEGKITGELAQEAKENALTVKSKMLLIISKAAAVILASLIIFSLLTALIKGFIWSRITKQKFDKAYFKRYLLFIVIIIACLLLISIASFFLLKDIITAFLMIIIIVFSIYLSIVFSIFYKKEKRMKELIKKTLSISFKRIHFFILPFLTTLIVLCLTIIIFSNINRLNPMLPYITILFPLAVLTLSKFYLYQTSKTIK